MKSTKFLEVIFTPRLESYFSILRFGVVMGRDTLRDYVPGSYEEEMEQLRIALELSARPSAP